MVDDDPGVRAGVERFLRAPCSNRTCFHLPKPLGTTPISTRRFVSFSTSTLAMGSLGIELRQGLTAAGVLGAGDLHHWECRKPAVREAALGSGCIAFLTKPFSARELIEPLNSAAAASHIASMKETFPHFEPQMTKSGRWFVLVENGKRAGFPRWRLRQRSRGHALDFN